MTQTRIAKASYLRNFIFGVEDSLVSTVGLLSGIAIAGVPRGTIFATGVILILVEAFSMAAGSFLSETSAEEYEGHVSKTIPMIDGIIMFFSYIGAGLIPLIPYMFYEVDKALHISVALGLMSLLILGMIGGAYIHAPKRIFRRGIRMLLIGGVAILVGVLAGQITGI